MSIKKLFNKLFGRAKPEFSEDEYQENQELDEQESDEEEPGVIKKYTLIDLMDRTITAPEKNYVPTCIKMYEDKCCFEFNAFYNDDNRYLEFEPYTCEAPYTPGQKKVSITIEGIEFVWDDEDGFFRWIPYGEAEKAIVFNKWIEYFSNGELRIQKEYAEHNLSQGALDYAFYSCDEYYSWNVDDGSYAVVMYEIPGAMRTISSGGLIKLFEVEVNRAVRDIGYVTKYYNKELPDMNLGMLYDQYLKNEKRVLWEPDDE